MRSTIQSALSRASEVSQLEAERLLAHSLKVNRAYLHTHPEQTLTSSQDEAFNELLLRAALGEPLAYLIGREAFWTFELKVTPKTLVPRPETELLVEQAVALLSDRTSELVIADLGTGSGAVALALAVSLPNAKVYAVDISAEALAVAKDNAAALGLHNVIFCEGSWFEALPDISFDLIVSNPPYVATDDPLLDKQVQQYEPSLALFSGADGLDAIRHIVQESSHKIQSGGYLLLEHGCQQAKSVRDLFSVKGYLDIQTIKDLSGLDRVTMGKVC